MSRIAGLHRPADPRPSEDRGMVRRMLLCHAGIVEILSGPQGALGRITPSDRIIGGGAAEAAGLQVVLDGRILNAAELRTELADVPPGDASLFLMLFRQHGMAGALARVTGDFAIAVLDPSAGRLWLARDRFGVKPLYWTPVSGGIAFASQPRSLLMLPGVSAETDPSFVARFAASHYRTFDNDPGSSPYCDIRQLPAATTLEIAAGGLKAPAVYWRLEDNGDFTASEAELAEAYRAQLLRAVRQRVAAAARPVFTLSGGLDSSSVLCTAVELAGAPQQAVSCVYTDNLYDERNEIQDVIAGKVANWYPIEIGNHIDVTSIVASQVRLHDEPVATATWLSHLLLVERMAEQGFDAVFGGLGGDELNAGEYEYFPMHFADLRAAGDEQALAHEMACWAANHDHPVHRKNVSRGEDLMARLTDPAVPGGCRPDRARMLRYLGALRRDYFDLEAFVPVMDRPFRSYLKNRAFQDMARETLPCCLRAQDRHCAALGIESVNPFLDHELVEFMFQVPGVLKIRDGITKRLLRFAMRGILPEATRNRVKKTGWNAPAHMWFSDRVLADLRDRVTSIKFRERGIYDPAAVMKIIDDHLRIVATQAQEETHMMFLWQLVNLDSWLDSIEERVTGCTAG
jgi:asparagine synthase (glutamine-hydrolysing)